MDSTRDPWHFARPDLAANYLNGFKLELVAARGLFARRRMGKTEFLTKDLIPAAAAQKYMTAYVNLWEDTQHPGQAIAAAIWGAVQPKGIAKLWESLNTPVTKLKAGAKVPGGMEGSVELDLAQREKLSVSALVTALQAADARPRKKLLLVIDEAQVLAAPEHSGLAHALRAGLDTRKSGIKVLFAGSSEAALREMFSRASAPFFNWAPIEPFPLLGGLFVDHMVRQVKRVAKKPLLPADAVAAFQTLKETPLFFRWFVEQYVLYQLGVPAALEAALARVQDDSGYDRQWKALHRNDRAVLLLAAKGVQDLYGAAALKQLQTLLGEQRVTETTPRSALRRLIGPKLQILARVDHGHYRFEDQELQAWVANRRTAD